MSKKTPSSKRRPSDDGLVSPSTLIVGKEIEEASPVPSVSDAFKQHRNDEEPTPIRRQSPRPEHLSRKYQKEIQTIHDSKIKQLEIEATALPGIEESNDNLSEIIDPFDDNNSNIFTQEKDNNDYLNLPKSSFLDEINDDERTVISKMDESIISVQSKEMESIIENDNVSVDRGSSVSVSGSIVSTDFTRIKRARRKKTNRFRKIVKGTGHIITTQSSVISTSTNNESILSHKDSEISVGNNLDKRSDITMDKSQNSQQSAIRIAKGTGTGKGTLFSTLGFDNNISKLSQDSRPNILVGRKSMVDTESIEIMSQIKPSDKSKSKSSIVSESQYISPISSQKDRDLLLEDDEKLSEIKDMYITPAGPAIEDIDLRESDDSIPLSPTQKQSPESTTPSLIMSVEMDETMSKSTSSSMLTSRPLTHRYSKRHKISTKKQSIIPDINESRRTHLARSRRKTVSKTLDKTVDNDENDEELDSIEIRATEPPEYSRIQERYEVFKSIQPDEIGSVKDFSELVGSRNFDTKKEKRKRIQKEKKQKKREKEILKKLEKKRKKKLQKKLKKKKEKEKLSKKSKKSKKKRKSKDSDSEYELSDNISLNDIDDDGFMKPKPKKKLKKKKSKKSKKEKETKSKEKPKIRKKRGKKRKRDKEEIDDDPTQTQSQTQTQTQSQRDTEEDSEIIPIRYSKRRRLYDNTYTGLRMKKVSKEVLNRIEEDHKEQLKRWKEVDKIYTVKKNLNKLHDEIDETGEVLNAKRLKTPRRFMEYERGHDFNESIPVWIDLYKNKIDDINNNNFTTNGNNNNNSGKNNKNKNKDITMTISLSPESVDSENDNDNDDDDDDDDSVDSKVGRRLRRSRRLRKNRNRNNKNDKNSNNSKNNNSKNSKSSKSSKSNKSNNSRKRRKNSSESNSVKLTDNQIKKIEANWEDEVKNISKLRRRYDRYNKRRRNKVKKTTHITFLGNKIVYKKTKNSSSEAEADVISLGKPSDIDIMDVPDVDMEDQELTQQERNILTQSKEINELATPSLSSRYESIDINLRDSLSIRSKSVISEGIIDSVSVSDIRSEITDISRISSIKPVKSLSAGIKERQKKKAMNIDTIERDDISIVSTNKSASIIESNESINMNTNEIEADIILSQQVKDKKTKAKSQTLQSEEEEDVYMRSQDTLEVSHKSDSLSMIGRLSGVNNSITSNALSTIIGDSRIHNISSINDINLNDSDMDVSMNNESDSNKSDIILSNKKSSLTF